ncbi:MAG: arsenate reductase ArsC [Anaerolineae bacterium]
MSRKKRVLFLCTGNSARSQMAEGLVNHLLGDSWEALSAGTRPAGYVHPLAAKAMDELGIDISGQTSKSVEMYRTEPLDIVITVCDNAASTCPVWLGQGRVLHVTFPDPAAVTGTEEERLARFRTVRDAIQERIISLLSEESAWR